jgi:3-methyladenine DNA glycosylase AlkD
MSLRSLQKELLKYSDPKKAESLKRYFKTGKGDYGENEIFVGLSVPSIRTLSKKFKDLSFSEVVLLLQTKIHEHRLLALFILVDQFEQGDEKMKKKIFQIYLKLAPKFVNNWDLVDSSAHLIVGKYLENKPKDVLFRLAKSHNLWEKRIAIISTYHFIRNNNYTYTIKVARLLLNDSHDLIHKAVGWMLREVGKRNVQIEKQFLDKHAPTMPRTMLRYAIEKFPISDRKKYLNKKL